MEENKVSEITDINQENHVIITDNQEFSNFSALQSEINSLNYQVKKLEEETYSKNLQLAGQRQLIDTLQEKLSRYKDSKQEDSKKIEECLLWEKKYNDAINNNQMLDNNIQELKNKFNKDTQLLELELDNYRKKLGKIEEENFQFRKSISEYEIIDLKLKKELSEKEKLLKTLEENKKEKKKLEDLSEDLKKTIKEISEKNQNSDEKDKIIDQKNSEIAEVYEKLYKVQHDLNTVNEMLSTSEKFLADTKTSYHNILSRCQDLEASCKNLTDTNSVLLDKISKLNQELVEKISEIEILDKEIKRIRAEELISFSIKINPGPGNQDDLEYKMKYTELDREYRDQKVILENLTKEKQSLKQVAETIQKNLETITLQSMNDKVEYERSTNSLQQEYLLLKAQHEKLINYCSGIEFAVKSNSSQLQLLEESLSNSNRKLSEKLEEISQLEEANKKTTEILMTLSSEKLAQEILNRQKDTKIKNLASKLQFFENQIQEKNKELISKDNELMNADRQLDILKKKISSSSTRIKQIATEQIDSQKKKIDSYESEIKMLKEMIKSVQAELKYKQQEINKIKKTSPKKKDPLFDNSPLQFFKQKSPEQDLKLPPDPLKDSPFKKNQVNIFKSRSPFNISSKKELNKEDVPTILKHVIKGYLTSYVLFEKEKKELLKAFQEQDYNKRGLLDKFIVLEKCEEVVLDTSLLEMYGNEVDYKDFLEMNYHNQLQQIHRDLDINFSQVLPGTISISELKMIKQALRPLHRQIWDVIVDRITAEYPKEVDLYVVKQILSQVNITL
jgi:chromosome segregation ATPase